LRLIQLRLAASHKAIALQVGKIIESIFLEEDRQVKIYSSTPEKGPCYTLCSNDEIQHFASEAFIKSFAIEAVYGDIFAISSIESCRFVVFEGDGLIRICYSNDDKIDHLNELGVAVEDISSLLLTTDVFDYL
jgi:hypothetical protein